MQKRMVEMDSREERERDARVDAEAIRKVIASTTTEVPQVTEGEFEATARRR